MSNLDVTFKGAQTSIFFFWGGRGDGQRPYSPYLQKFTSYNFNPIKYVQIQNVDEI